MLTCFPVGDVAHADTRRAKKMFLMRVWSTARHDRMTRVPAVAAVAVLLRTRDADLMVQRDVVGGDRMVVHRDLVETAAEEEPHRLSTEQRRRRELRDRRAIGHRRQRDA